MKLSFLARLSNNHLTNEMLQELVFDKDEGSITAQYAKELKVSWDYVLISLLTEAEHELGLLQALKNPMNEDIDLALGCCCKDLLDSMKEALKLKDRDKIKPALFELLKFKNKI